MDGIVVGAVNGNLAANRGAVAPASRIILLVGTPGQDYRLGWLDQIAYAGALQG